MTCLRRCRESWWGIGDRFPNDPISEERDYYDQLKARGAKTYTARRALAYKWIRIIYRCWQNNEVYDEARYIQTLTQRKSPLIPAIRDLQLAGNKA